jgi:hypothetical protein
MATFLLSGLWHGASWNYVLWGLYHGMLLVVTRAGQPVRRESGASIALLQIPPMFLLTMIGWLLFRETSLGAIVHDLTLSPFHSTLLDRQVAAYLFILALLYSLPLWIQSVWVEFHRASHGSSEPTAPSWAWPNLAIQGIACGLAFAAILVLRSRTTLDFIYFRF